MPKAAKPPPPRPRVELAPPARPDSARDLARPGRAFRVGMSLYERVIWGLHGAYKVTLSPWIGRQCRFTPTCSDYAAEALTLHGPWRGGVLTVKRLCRCHPWGGHGFDPPPPRP